MIILTESERVKAINLYGFGWSFQEIAVHILEHRTEKIKREMVREIGVVCSQEYKRQMYPKEFYGKYEK